MNYQELWQRVLTDIELGTSRANFITWFQNTAIGDIKDQNSVIVYVPNAFTKEWLEHKYHKFILKTLRNILPEVKKVEYEISAELCRATQLTKKIAQPEIAEIQPEMQGLNLNIDQEANLNPRYTFESFIIGSFNELAHAAALAVTKNIGALYNPLFIYGGGELGKTHLWQAVGNKIKIENPKLKAQYLTSEKFASELVEALQNQSMNKFKEKYRKHDLLIIDDIQFIAGKTKSQEELFHTFNTLYESNKQIVFSSDQPPKYIPNLEERLRSRFEGGMIVDISEPEYEARVAILKSKAAAKGISLPPKILEYIASAIQNNIRELEGALNLIAARTAILKTNLELTEIKDLLNKNIKPKKAITANQIIKTVSQFYDIQEKFLFEKTRRKEVVKPRQIAMYLLRQDFSGSYPYIGQKFGGRDHTTVIHAYEKISNDLKNNERLKEEIKNIRDLINKSA